MAVSSTLNETLLTLRFVSGIDTNGKDVVKSLNLSKIKTQASDEDLFVVGQAIGSILRYPVLQILRKDENLLISD